jgi:hypothetical protein
MSFGKSERNCLSNPGNKAAVSIFEHKYKGPLDTKDRKWVLSSEGSNSRSMKFLGSAYLRK